MAETATTTSPSEADVKKLKLSDLNKLYATGDYGEIEDWGALSITQKKEALIEKINGGDGDVLVEPPVEDEVVEEIHATAEEDNIPHVAVVEPTKTKAKAKPKGDAGGDLIAATVQKVENLKDAATAHKALAGLIESNSAWEFEIGAYLAAIQAKAWFGEHDSLRKFIENETPLHYRKAMNLIEIYTGLVESGVEWSQVGHIGWTKVLLLIPVVNPDNVEAWVNKAESVSYNQLAADVQAYLDAQNAGTEAPDPAGPSETVVSSVTFKLHKDQKETVDLALEKAMKAGNTDVKAVALDYIATEFLAGPGKKAAPKAADITAESAAKTIEVKDFLVALRKLAGEAKAMSIADAVMDAYGEVFPEVDITATFPE